MKFTKIHLLSIVLFPICAFAQTLPITENFQFTGNLTANGWLNYPSVGVNTSFPATATVSTGLTFTNYSQSGIGNAAQILGDGEDVYKPFDAQTSGVVYAGAMIQVNAASLSSSGDYFYHFYGKNSGGINYQFVRFYAKDNGATNPGFVVAVNKTTLGPVVNGSNVAPLIYSSVVYPYGSVIYVVLKYEFNPNSNPDDPVSAYVFDSSAGISAIEPSTPTLGPVILGATAAGDAGQLLGVSLRRSDTNMNILVDGIRVANTWSMVLPVKLSRFDVKKEKESALISWDVELEKESPSYTIQHSKDGVHFENIYEQKSKYVEKVGRQKYEKVVNDLDKGIHYFRLKMTDVKGWIDYSEIKSVTILPTNSRISIKDNTLKVSFLDKTFFESDFVLNIFDYEGRLVKSFSITDSEQSFDLNDLNNGSYFISSNVELSINGFRFSKY